MRRDGDTHEYRRHLGSGKVLQTDLLPLVMTATEENEMSDVLLRLLINLTNPTLLLYREELPKDGPNRRIYLHLIEILQSYKAAFSMQSVWMEMEKRLQKMLEIVSHAPYNGCAGITYYYLQTIILFIRIGPKERKNKVC